MADLPKWRDMACQCGGLWFMEVHTYRWHPTGGTSKGETQQRCVQCGELTNPQQARALHRRQQLEAELAGLQEQLSETEPATAETSRTQRQSAPPSPPSRPLSGRS